MYQPGDSSLSPDAVQALSASEAALTPEMQRRLKVLVQQLRAALHRGQLAPEVELEIAQLVSDLNLARHPDLLPRLLKTAMADTALTLETRQTLEQLFLEETGRQRLEALIKQVRLGLPKNAFSAQAQRELSRLLALLPYLQKRPDLMNEFELAITALTTPENPDQGRKNLRFARHLRRQLAVQLKQNASPLWAIISASGTPHNRLMSGLSWFLLLFSLVPMLLSGAFFLLAIEKQNKLIAEAREKSAELRAARDELADTESSLETLRNRISRANQDLTNLQLRPLYAPVEEEASPALPSLQDQQVLLNSVETSLTNSEETLETLRESALPALQAKITSPNRSWETPEDREELVDDLAEINQSLEQIATTFPDAVENITQLKIYLDRLQLQLEGREEQLIAIRNVLVTTSSRSDEASSDPSAPSDNPTAGAMIDPASPQSADLAPGTQNADDVYEQLLVFLASLTSADMALLLAVVATGALGSFVSVIVRANEFIAAEHESDMDLFLVGFFRPIVGMAFAFFLIALLESGLFSNILRLDVEDAGKKVYLYVAIAFVAGFSERLVKDIVGQTAEIVGPAKKS